MFSGIRRALTPSSGRPDTSSTPPRRAGPQPASPTDPALAPRRGGDEGAAQPSTSRAPRNRNAFAALTSRMRSPQAGSSRPSQAQAPLTIAQDLAQWSHAAAQNLHNMIADHGQYSMNAEDVRPIYLRALANAVTRAAEQGSPRLDIQFLPAEDLPQSIGRLPHLQELSIMGTECKKLPDSLGDLSSLTTLLMGGNSDIKRLPDSITKLDKLTTLQATAMPLEALPQEIGNLRELTVLQLGGGRYQHLPQGFTNLSALKELDLINPSRSGGLQGLPDNIGRLQALEKLDLGNQRDLRTIPDSLTELRQLQVLNLAGCSQLRGLPQHLGQLQSLKTLSLKRNEALHVLPDSLSNLAQLEQLDLAHCKNLQTLPDNLGNLSQLRKLDLTGCTSLRELPASLSRLPANCEILVPRDLQAQLHLLRPPQRRARPAARPGAPARTGAPMRPTFRPEATALPPRRTRPAATPPPVTATQVAAWKARLAPFASEDGANRFAQWTDAVCQLRGDGMMTPNGVAKMDRIVQAASTSAPLRAKLFAFATEHVRVQRDMESGITMNNVPAETFTGVKEAHDVYLTHMVSDPRQASPDAAYALLGQAVRERFGRMAPDEALHALAGRAPRGLPSDEYTARPWPVLAAYVQTHDQAGQDFTTRAGDVLGALSEASKGNHVNEQQVKDGAATLKHAQAMLLHDRYLAVAKELLAQHAAARTPAVNPAPR